jgi:hypothetical protein
MRGECCPGSLAISGVDVGPRARSRSSVRPRFVDVKMRLIALWRQSLVRNERSHSWTLFSNSKKGIGRRSVTPPKLTIDVYYKVFRSFQERAAPCPSVASGNVLTHLPFYAGVGFAGAALLSILSQPLAQPSKSSARRKC